MSQSELSQIYLVPVDRSCPPDGMMLPKDAGWIYTAPDPDVDAVAEFLGDANDRPVQVIRELGERHVDQGHLIEVIEACARGGPNPVLVVNAAFADRVRQFASVKRARVEDLTWV